MGKFTAEKHFGYAFTFRDKGTVGLKADSNGKLKKERSVFSVFALK